MVEYIYEMVTSKCSLLNTDLVEDIGECSDCGTPGQPEQIVVEDAVVSL